MLKSELGEEKRPGKKKGGRRAREKGRDAKSQAGRRPHQELAGPRRREEVGTGRAKQRRRASREPAPPAPRVPVPSLSRATGAVFVAGKEKQGWAGGEDAPPPLSGARAFLTRPRFRTLVPPRPDLAERL